MAEETIEMTETAKNNIVDDFSILEVIAEGRSMAEKNDLPEGFYKLQVIAAQNAMDQQDFNSAARLAMLAASTDHKRPEAWSLLGNVQRELGAYQTAIECWSMAYRLGNDPRVALAILQMAIPLGLRDGVSDMIAGLRVSAANDKEFQHRLDQIEHQLSNEE